jgi:glycosyltransferase involved in cell wall biosynthesis
MSEPQVSVCVPVYQGAEYIGRAIESVLAQSFGSFELVVRDNGSTDGTAEIVRSFDDPRIRLERAETTVPMPDNWNRTVALAQAPLVKVVCADDVLRPGALGDQVRLLRSDPSIAVSAGRVDMIDAEDRVLFANRHVSRPLVGAHSRTEVLRAVVRHGGNPIGPSVSITFRRKDFDAAGGFDGTLLFTMDLDMWVRLLAFGKLHGDRRTAGAFRVHGDSESAAATREQFAIQRKFTDDLIRDAGPVIRRRDVAAGTVGAYTALARRYALFLTASARARAIAGRRRDASSTNSA